MRHRKKFNHLGRKANHRKAMLANMATSLILHKRIKTTTAKAKALRVYVEPLITKSKDDSTHTRRVVFGYLQNKEAVTELFREVSPKVSERPGGYTRILKTGTRLGDSAEMCVIELVDYNENLLSAKEEAAAKTGRRRRRGGKKKETEGAPQAAATTETVTKDTAMSEAEKTVTDEETVVDSKAEPVQAEPVEEKTDKADETATDVIEEVKEEVQTETKEESKEDKSEEKFSAEEKKDEIKSETSTDTKTNEAEDKKEDQ